MNLWAVVRVTGEYEDVIDFRTFKTKEEAIEIYEEWKSELKEWVDDTGFTGDEALYMARIVYSLDVMTIVNEEKTGWKLGWDEFKGGNDNE